MSKSALTVLREARELISDPKRWTQGAISRDASGGEIAPSSERAVCWCSLGAIERIAEAGSYFATSAYYLLYLQAEKANGLSVSSTNDELGHEAVLRMFDAAIASAEAEASR